MGEWSSSIVLRKKETSLLYLVLSTIIVEVHCAESEKSNTTSRNVYNRTYAFKIL